MKKPKRKHVMKYADGGQVKKKTPVPRVKPIERAAKGWDANKGKLPYWNSYAEEPFVKGEASAAEKNKLTKRINKEAEKKYQRVKNNPDFFDPGLEKYKEMSRANSAYNTRVYNEGVEGNKKDIAARKKKPANLQKAKDKPRHYAKGGLVKGVSKKR